MADVLTNITRVPELRNRILFTLGLLGVYRLGHFRADAGRRPRGDE